MESQQQMPSLLHTRCVQMTLQFARGGYRSNDLRMPTPKSTCWSLRPALALARHIQAAD